MIRKTDEGIKSSPYWKAHPYNFDGTALVGQCTWYVLGRLCERLGYAVTNWDSMPNCSPNPIWSTHGALNAKDWLRNCLWQVSSKPRADAIVVLGGNYGHVAYIEEDEGNGKYSISQYNKLSDKKFHYETVDLTGTKLYGMQILGYIYAPVIQRDTTKHQARVKVDSLRVRTEHTTNASVVGFCANGELFDVYDVYQDDYKWLNVGRGWIATKTEWVDEYLPATLGESVDELKASLKEKENEVNELKKQVTELKRLNQICDDAAKVLNEKIEKAIEVLK